MRFGGHTHFVTVGRAIGRPDCDGADLRPSTGSPTLPAGRARALAGRPRGRPRRAHDGRATGAATARSSTSGVHYGQKAHSLRPLIDLPPRTARAVRARARRSTPTSDGTSSALTANGWELVDPAQVAGTPDGYRRFVQRSKAEFGIAKSGYVAVALRLVQRPQRLLPRLRPAGDRAGHRLQPLPADRRGAVRVRARPTTCSRRSSELRAATTRATRRAARALAEECFDSDKRAERLLSASGARMTPRRPAASCAARSRAPARRPRRRVVDAAAVRRTRPASRSRSSTSSSTTAARLALLFKDLSPDGARRRRARGQARLPATTRGARSRSTATCSRRAARHAAFHGAVVDAGARAATGCSSSACRAWSCGRSASWTLAAASPRWLARCTTRFAAEPRPGAGAATCCATTRRSTAAGCAAGAGELCGSRRTARRGARPAGRAATSRSSSGWPPCRRRSCTASSTPPTCWCQQAEPGSRVCPSTGRWPRVGPGLLDLAALTPVAGRTSERTELVAGATTTRCRAPAGWAPGRPSSATALDCCRLHLAVQWLGWAADWSPPAEHAPRLARRGARRWPSGWGCER